jgi:hypothetical protein
MSGCCHVLLRPSFRSTPWAPAFEPRRRRPLRPRRIPLRARDSRGMVRGMKSRRPWPASGAGGGRCGGIVAGRGHSGRDAASLKSAQCGFDPHRGHLRKLALTWADRPFTRSTRSPLGTHQYALFRVLVCPRRVLILNIKRSRAVLRTPPGTSTVHLPRTGERPWDQSNRHHVDTIDLTHARWAAGTAITAIDLSAAALGARHRLPAKGNRVHDVADLSVCTDVAGHGWVLSGVRAGIWAGLGVRSPRT